MFKKLKDISNVVKYRKRYNTLENKYISLQESYTDLLEKDRSMLDENINLKNKLIDKTKELKEMKVLLSKEVKSDGKNKSKEN